MKKRTLSPWEEYKRGWWKNILFWFAFWLFFMTVIVFLPYLWAIHADRFNEAMIRETEIAVAFITAITLFAAFYTHQAQKETAEFCQSLERSFFSLKRRKMVEEVESSYTKLYHDAIREEDNVGE